MRMMRMRLAARRARFAPAIHADPPVGTLRLAVREAPGLQCAP